MWKEKVLRNQSDLGSNIAYLSDLGEIVCSLEALEFSPVKCAYLYLFSQN